MSEPLDNPRSLSSALEVLKCASVLAAVPTISDKLQDHRKQDDVDVHHRSYADKGGLCPLSLSIEAALISFLLQRPSSESRYEDTANKG